MTEHDAPEPCVGIFWVLPNSAGTVVIISDRTSLKNAERYGEFLTHSAGHYEVWERWRPLQPSALKRMGIPTAIKWQEYEDFPRGRVVHDTRSATFTLYADRKLQRPPMIDAIAQHFGLANSTYAAASDPHYRSPQ